MSVVTTVNAFLNRKPFGNDPCQRAPCAWATYKCSRPERGTD